MPPYRQNPAFLVPENPASAVPLGVPEELPEEDVLPAVRDDSGEVLGVEGRPHHCVRACLWEEITHPQCTILQITNHSLNIAPLLLPFVISGAYVHRHDGCIAIQSKKESI